MVLPTPGPKSEGDKPKSQGDEPELEDNELKPEGDRLEVEDYEPNCPSGTDSTTKTTMTRTMTQTVIVSPIVEDGPAPTAIAIALAGEGEPAPLAIAIAEHRKEPIDLPGQPPQMPGQGAPDLPPSSPADEPPSDAGPPVPAPDSGPPAPEPGPEPPAESEPPPAESEPPAPEPGSPPAGPEPPSDSVPPPTSGPPPPGPEAPSDSAVPGKGPDTSGSKLFGISYAPYRADHGCKTAQDITDDFYDFAKDYSMVRIYGTDCDQVPPTYKVAKSMGVKLMMGIWDIHQVEKEATKIIEGLEGDWEIVHSVSVGNELVNNGKAHPAQVVDAIRQARQILRNAGYEGPVVTVDTFIAVEKYPELCEESDFCAINAHPFFDSTMRAEDAGKWLVGTIEAVKSKLSKPMDVIITETGWPMNGAPNGLAVPNLENQRIAIDAIKAAYVENPGDVVLFSAFNDLWKQRDMNSFNADQYWGIGGAISRADTGASY